MFQGEVAGFGGDMQDRWWWENGEEARCDCFRCRLWRELVVYWDLSGAGEDVGVDLEADFGGEVGEERKLFEGWHFRHCSRCRRVAMISEALSVSTELHIAPSRIWKPGERRNVGFRGLLC